MRKYAILRMPDWLGVYVDGVLEYEGHSIEPDDLLDVLGISYDYLYVDDDTFWGGRAPSLWGEWEDEPEEKVFDDEA